MPLNLSDDDTKDFFISYHEEDRKWAEWVAWQLEDAGYTTIIQAWDFRPGLHFVLEKHKALETAKRIIVIISPDYLSACSSQQAEWTAIFSKDPTGEKGLLLPARVYDCEPGGLLASIIRIDLFGKDESKAKRELLEGVEEKRLKPSTSPGFPGKAEPEFPGKFVRSNAEKRSSKSSATKIGTTVRICNHAKQVNSVTWSPNGERIAAGDGNGVVFIWNIRTGNNPVTYYGHSKGFAGTSIASTVRKVSWSPDGTHIASSGYGREVHIWHANTGEFRCSHPDPNVFPGLAGAYPLAWSPDSKYIVSVCSPKQVEDQTIPIWEALTGNDILKYAGHDNKSRAVTFSVTSLAWSPDGQYIASCGSDRNVKKRELDPTKAPKSIQIWNPTTGQHISTCVISSDWTNSITWSPDSRHIASAEPDATVNIWEAATGEKLFTYRGHAQSVRAVAWSPNGSIIASAGNDHEVRLWNPYTGKLCCVYREHTGTVLTLAWSPDGERIASAGDDKIVRIWQAV